MRDLSFTLSLQLDSAHVRQVAVQLLVVHAAADHELVRDLKTEIIDVYVHLAAARLLQKAAKTERGRLAVAQKAEKKNANVFKQKTRRETQSVSENCTKTAFLSKR